MIVRITGKLIHVDSDRAVLERDGMCYELFMPAFALPKLSEQSGQEITLYTFQYYETTPVGSTMYPRLLGFLDPLDRSFFTEFIKVRGMGIRKALRAFARPASWIAEAIERNDVKLLTTLPEVGKRTAEQLVTSLKGKLDSFAQGQADEVRHPLTQAEHEAMEILLQLGERESDVRALIERAMAVDKTMSDAGVIVEAVYKLKSGSI